MDDTDHTRTDGRKTVETAPASNQGQLNDASAAPTERQTTRGEKDAREDSSSASGRSTVRRSTSLATFILGSALLIWLFQSEISAAVRVWRDSETFGHAFFIFPIILLLFFRLRGPLAGIQPAVAPWALIPIIVLTLVWLLGRLTNLTIVQQLAFVAIWQCFFLLTFGWAVTREAIFPLSYLYMAVPFGLSVIPLLQNITAQIVVRLLRITGVPVFLDGYHIEIPDGSFLVAEACSGVRYLIVCIALGILAAYLFFRSWKRRLLFVGLSVVVPIVANGIRAYGIVMIAHLSHYTLAVDVDHVVYGFIFLSLVTLCLLGLGALLRDRNPGHFDVSNLPVAPKYPSASKPALQVSSAVVAIAVVFSAQHWASVANAPPANRDVALRGPAVGHPWELLTNAPKEWMPDFRGMDAELQKSFLSEGRRVELYVAYYAYQREGSEAVSDLNAVPREGSAWKLLRGWQTNVSVGGELLPVNQALLGHPDQTMLVWYWYWIGGEVTNSRLQGKLLETKSLVTGGERDAAIVAVSTKVTENVEEAAALMRDFLQQGIGPEGMTLQVAPTSPQSSLSSDLRPLNILGDSVAP